MDMQKYFGWVSSLLLLSGLAAFGADDWISYKGKEGPGKGKQVVFLAGDEEYRSEEGLPMLAKILSQRHGFDCTVLFSVDKDGMINPEAGGSLSHPESLDQADAIVMLLRFRHWPEETMKRFEPRAKNRAVTMTVNSTPAPPRRVSEIPAFGWIQ